MEIRQLTYFLAAVQTQNFRKAADLCLVAQSALSRQIAALEAELGVELFERKQKHVFLTSAGKTFAIYARNALEQLQLGQQEMSFMQEDLGGMLRIGCIETLVAPYLPELLTYFHQQCPHVHIQVTVTQTDELLGLVERGELDLGLIFDPTSRPELLVVKEVFRQSLHLMLALDHPLVQADPQEITLERIVAEPLFLLSSTFRLRRIIDRIVIQKGFIMHPIVEIDSIEGLKDLVKQGGGVTIVLPSLVKPKELGRDCILRPIVDLPDQFIFALVYRRVGPLEGAVKQFIKLILDTAWTGNQ
jgi:Transcriptional regulator